MTVTQQRNWCIIITVPSTCIRAKTMLNLILVQRKLCYCGGCNVTTNISEDRSEGYEISFSRSVAPQMSV